MDLPKISNIEIVPVRPQKGLIGFASFLIDNAFAINGIGVHSRPDGSGIRLLYPEKIVNGLKLSLFHPIRKDIGDRVTALVEQEFGRLHTRTPRGSGEALVNSHKDPDEIVSK